LDADFPNDAVEIGRILGAWGVKGWFKVQPFSQDPQALFSSKRWFIRPGSQVPPTQAAAMPALLKIVQAKEHAEGVVASAQDISDRSQAEALKGASIFVSRASFPTPADGEYYWVDLIGLDVINREGQHLGQVTDLLDTGAHGVLRVQDSQRPDEPERLIPFVSAYVDEVSQEQRRITVDWGLDF
jgi:16S rRNA processing protein RimM